MSQRRSASKGSEGFYKLYKYFSASSRATLFQVVTSDVKQILLRDWR